MFDRFWKIARGYVFVCAGLAGMADGGHAGPPGRVKMSLSSSAFKPGNKMPVKFTGEGEDVSPPLRWTDVPAGVRQFALVCDDPDAPTSEPWVHWVIYGIAGDVRALPEAIPPRAEIKKPVVARQGKNSWPRGRNVGYRGPMPPPGHGLHHYRFRLYALGSMYDLSPGIDKRALLKAIRRDVVAEAELVGTYKR
ncbi:MAG: YbhB/YbcL family Raf kinase inhibitor-like protein [Pirellulales bacterium]